MEHTSILKHLGVDKVHIERIQVDVVYWRWGETSKHAVHFYDFFRFRLSSAWQNLQFHEKLSAFTAP